MAPNDRAGRIHKVPFLVRLFYSRPDNRGISLLIARQAICTTLFIISLLFVVARTLLRLHYQNRLYIDDAFLFFAVLCLCAVMILLYVTLETMFMAEAFIVIPFSADIPPDFLNRISKLHKISTAFIILSYTAICAVKFSFLFFFRTLVRRIPGMMKYWQVVVVITGIAWVTGSIGAVFPCPYYDPNSTSKILFQFSLCHYN